MSTLLEAASVTGDVRRLGVTGWPFFVRHGLSFRFEEKCRTVDGVILVLFYFVQKGAPERYDICERLLPAHFVLSCGR